MIWPVVLALGLVAVCLRWSDRPRQPRTMVLLVIAVGLGYAWLGLGKG